MTEDTRPRAWRTRLEASRLELIAERAKLHALAESAPTEWGRNDARRDVDALDQRIQEMAPALWKSDGGVKGRP